MNEESKLVLTPAALLAFLTNIEELVGKDISISEGAEDITVTIGEGTYVIESPKASEVAVDDEAIEEIDKIDDECYDEIDYVEEDFDEVIGEEGDDLTIEGGVIKELAKTLLVGGLVRLTTNAIKNS